MAWEIFIVNVDGNFRSRNEAAEDEHLLDLGSAEEVKGAVVEAFPGTLWSEGAGTWAGDGGTVQFDIGDDPDAVQTLDLHVDADDDVVLRILDLTGSQGWRSGDSADGEFLELLDDPAEALRIWRDHHSS
jgi:hypothetical protein